MLNVYFSFEKFAVTKLESLIPFYTYETGIHLLITDHDFTATFIRSFLSLSLPEIDRTFFYIENNQ